MANSVHQLKLSNLNVSVFSVCNEQYSRLSGFLSVSHLCTPLAFTFPSLHYTHTHTHTHTHLCFTPGYTPHHVRTADTHTYTLTHLLAWPVLPTPDYLRWEEHSSCILNTHSHTHTHTHTHTNTHTHANAVARLLCLLNSDELLHLALFEIFNIDINN